LETASSSEPIFVSAYGAFRDSVNGTEASSDSIKLGENKLTNSSGRDLNRPLQSPADFDWDSEYGLLVMGTDLARQKNYPEAEVFLMKALQVNPNLVPALAGMAQIRYRQGLYQRPDFAEGTGCQYLRSANYF
jgi:hypothetical protein